MLQVQQHLRDTFTRRAAQDAFPALCTLASSVHKLAFEYGFRWTRERQWLRLSVGDVDPWRMGAIYMGPGAKWVLSSRTSVDELDRDPTPPAPPRPPSPPNKKHPRTPATRNARSNVNSRAP